MRRILPAVALLLFVVKAAQAEIVPLSVGGPDANRVKVVICAEGYTTAQRQTFINDMNSVISYMFGGGGVNADPYPRYHNYFNVYGLFMPSAQSGLGGYFGSSISGDRLLNVNTTTVANTVAAQFPAANWTAVAANTATYCGGGYIPGPACFAAENGSAPELLLHESGHSWHSFLDTYTLYPYTYDPKWGDPGVVNLTCDSTGAKWSEWLGYNQPGVGTIGAYNGAYYASGLYSPASYDKMRYLYAPFDAICREAIIQDIYSIVRPLDSYTTNTATLVNPASIAVSPVDDSVVSVHWTVDGQPYTPASQDSLSVPAMGLSPGVHTIAALANDATPWVRRGAGPLSETVNWTVKVPLSGDANLDDRVDVSDLSAVLANYNKSGLDWGQGDFNRDGAVNVNDLGQVLTNYNHTMAISAARAVPEPSAAILLGAAIAVLLSSSICCRL